MSKFHANIFSNYFRASEVSKSLGFKSQSFSAPHASNKIDLYITLHNLESIFGEMFF